MRDFFWSPYGCNDRPNLDMRNIFAGSHTEHRWRCSKSEGGNGSHHLSSSKKHMLIHPTRTFPSSRPLTKGLWECNGGRRAAWLRVSVKSTHRVVWHSMAVAAATLNLLLPFAPFSCTISRRSSSSAIVRLLHLPNSGANSSRWRRTRGSRWRWRSSRTVRSLVVAAPAVGMVQAGGDMVVELVVGVAGGLILLSAIAVGLSWAFFTFLFPQILNLLQTKLPFFCFGVQALTFFFSVQVLFSWWSGTGEKKSIFTFFE